jgi:release factor glutamine methyltransferase
VAAADPHLQRGDVRFEPRSALAAGADGLDAIRVLADTSRRVLAPAGWLFLEHAPMQIDKIRNILLNNNYFDLQTTCDLAGRGRVTQARRAP